MTFSSPDHSGANKNGAQGSVFYWTCGRFAVDLTKPKIVGIVNVTPDSFFDGGQHANTSAALSHCEALLKAGADMLDIGGESSRPGAPALPLSEELARVLPVVREAVRLQVPISVDTYKSDVMRAVLDAGADIINDIWALRQPGALSAVVAHPNCGICLMHMHGEPRTMQLAPMGATPAQSISSQVLSFLRQRTDDLLAESVNNSRISWDVGIGFGKSVSQNFELLANLPRFVQHGYPQWAAWSRKSSLGAVTGLPVEHRMVPSVAAALLAVERGARIVRVHDVTETQHALKVWQALAEHDQTDQSEEKPRTSP